LGILKKFQKGVFAKKSDEKLQHLKAILQIGAI
jgi:hypothetical protein